MQNKISNSGIRFVSFIGGRRDAPAVFLSPVVAMMAMTFYQGAICQKSLIIFLSSGKYSYTSILFARVDYSSYLCSAFRIVGSGRPTHERKMPTVSTAMCDEREPGKRAAFLLPLFT